MLLAQVESFLEVVRTGSLTKAADALFVTQPTLSERLRSLEDELGKPLFARTRRYGLQLTEAGEAFLPHAERLVSEAHEGAAAVASTDRDANKNLNIAVANIVGSSVLARTLEKLRNADPHAVIHVHSGTPSQVVQLILRRRVDVGLARAVRDSRVENSPVYSELIVPVVAPAHRLASAQGLRARDLAGESIITLSETQTYEFARRAVTRGDGVPAPLPLTVDDVEIARALVAERAGVAFLPLGSVVRDVEQGGMVRLDITDLPPAPIRITSLRLFDAQPESRIIENFIICLREAGAEVMSHSPATTRG